MNIYFDYIRQSVVNDNSLNLKNEKRKAYYHGMIDFCEKFKLIDTKEASSLHYMVIKNCESRKG